MAITFSAATGKRFTDNGGSYPGDNLYTVPSGSDRILFIIAARRGDQNTNATVDGVTYGGQAATVLQPNTFHLAGFRSLTYSVWYIKEADIPAGENALAYTDSDNLANATQYAYCFSAFGVDQATNPTINVIEHSNTSGGAATVVHTFGANSGKTALGFIICQGENSSGDFTLTPDSGTNQFPYDKNYQHGLGWIGESAGIHTRGQSFIPLANNSTSLSWDTTYANLGVTQANNAIITVGLFLEEATNTTITIDQSIVVPGGTISGTYSGFTPGTPPTTPIVLSDGTNSLNVAVTITPANPDDGTGTFTGTVPSLPPAGNSGNFLLFGNITATLDDA